ncbi:acetyl/propionyl/methylcrotonyl-CoA carboxylase subunit alpha [Ilumatobacter sp.]|uniref:acetyl/propionyl/methylcrotonyl-CoA carboxylase subunit alpha n=1 Tax=Ilumatobacter sp. TaxID=1967498 RepID=UPI0030B1D894
MTASNELTGLSDQWAPPEGTDPAPQRPINKLLIANRGEIAVRIARTAHRLGMGTVGVYSEPDANALHVDSVDVAVALGGETAAESYLRGDAIIAAAKATGADAIHPGYGFLAENAVFAQAVEDAGLIWVGPTPEQITLLGDKVAAKRAAVEAGVPTTPIWEVGDDGAVPDGVPMPALVKAAAGGGGRGMRVVTDPVLLAESILSASREAKAAFGDGAVFIEPYIERGRHIEVQIMGDQYGHVVHLGERECSIQRRNQKVIEESPSSGISEATRAAVCEGALALARAVQYVGAGTVEFLVGESDNGQVINFLEVNTRLQVEHPVTEEVTGFDLVEMQLRVASGEPLGVSQDEVTVTGHAIEVRVVAENPATNWMPSTGEITAFDVSDDVRTDTGIRAGAVISPNYDSLLAKVIAYAPTRHDAARLLARALRTSQVKGVDTNIDMLVATLGERDFLAAKTPTAYLAEHPDVLTPAGPVGDDRVALLLAAVFAEERRTRGDDKHHGFAPSGFRTLRIQGQRQTWTDGATDHQVEYVVDSRSTASVSIGAWPTPTEHGALATDERREIVVRLLARTDDREVIEVDGVRHAVDVSIDGAAVRTRSAAGSVVFTQLPRFVEHELDDAGGGPVCPLPGTVIAVHVEVGQTVGEGHVLMVVEAMKMEHKITATTAATVGEVRFAVGDRVDQGDLLVALEATE